MDPGKEKIIRDTLRKNPSGDLKPLIVALGAAGFVFTPHGLVADLQALVEEGKLLVSLSHRGSHDSADIRAYSVCLRPPR